MTSDRYDRQVRLWGDEGQSAIGEAQVCVLGSSALVTEILKSLVLAGVNSFTIVDDSRVTEEDLGNNFFLEESHLGKPRGEAALRLLKELNPSVLGAFIDRSPSSLDRDHLDQLTGKFSVVIGVNLPESHAGPLSAALYNHVPFILARVYGFLGFLRICVKEHNIANSHPEHALPDLRLDRPFPGMAELIDSIEMEKMSDEEVRHTPYLILYAIALRKYRESLSDPTAFPSTYAERKSLLKHVMDLSRDKASGGSDENFDQARDALNRSIHRTEVPPSVRRVLSDEKCSGRSAPSSSFWLLCTALRSFVDRHGVLPLSGELPDMASDTISYTRLVSIFHEKAQADANEVYEEILRLQKLFPCKFDRSPQPTPTHSPNSVERMETDEEKSNPAGGPPTSPSWTPSLSREAVARFCRNAASIDVQTGSPAACQQGHSFQQIIDKIVSEDEAELKERKVTPAIWLLLLRAADRFHDEKDRFPGPCDSDVADLRQRVANIVSETLDRTRQKRADEGEEEERHEGVKAEVIRRISDGVIQEMCRYRASEPHVVASLLGGIAAQEVIKLATKQYTPIDNTLIYDAHTFTTQTFAI